MVETLLFQDCSKTRHGGFKHCMIKLKSGFAFWGEWEWLLASNIKAEESCLSLAYHWQNNIIQTKALLNLSQSFPGELLKALLQISNSKAYQVIYEFKLDRSILFQSISMTNYVYHCTDKKPQNAFFISGPWQKPNSCVWFASQIGQYTLSEVVSNITLGRCFGRTLYWTTHSLRATAASPQFYANIVEWAADLWSKRTLFSKQYLNSMNADLCNKPLHLYILRMESCS